MRRSPRTSPYAAQGRRDPRAWARGQGVRHILETGNFGFCVQEHINLGARYDQDISIFGMEFHVITAVRGHDWRGGSRRRRALGSGTGWRGRHVGMVRAALRRYH
ncbi:hypothetical protein FIBSPDRAFT_130975 [Athelia psychrophila]|uniref:Uncharacterized protein n=1 Tax=Athelia psychrophila TaxID=1759441 RepID=A0A166CCM0_9AGAM|nr:hypothetical protein FIBSPDRAFT_130975 [Fibularhizoctonia sp. CBS 109695]